MISTEQQTTCFHCGDTCVEGEHTAHDHSFCCHGCQTVYEILLENDMAEYYRLESKPGTKKKSQESSLAWLDQPEMQAQLWLFREGNIGQVRLFMPAIHCSSCIWLLENLTQIHHGVRQSEVQFIKREAFITLDTDLLSLRELVELLHKIGYPPEITLANLGKQHQTQHRPQRKLALKIGVAGFAFGNIMLLSLPEYVDGGFGLEGKYATFFAYLNVLLGLPVLLFSGRDYLFAAIKSLRQRFVSIDVPIALGMLVLFGRSTWEIFTHTGAGYMDSFTGLVFFLLIGKWFQTKTYQSLSFERDYMAYFPVAVTLLANGDEHSMALKEVKKGDRLLIRNGELIPADATLLSDQAQVDYSFITGEAEPVRKVAGEHLHAGGRQVGPAIEVRVEKPVAQSRLTQLWNQRAFHKEGKESLPNLVDQLAKRFTLGVLLVALVSAIAWWGHGIGQVASVVTAILIVACPCALALTLPFTYGHAMRWLGRRGLYLKESQVVERMADLDTLVFDKTGTITQSQGHEVTWHGPALAPMQLGGLKACFRQSSHPLSQAIYQHLPSTGQACELDGFEEIPGHGVRAQANGHTYRLGSAALAGYPVTNENQDTTVWVNQDGKPLGYFTIATPYRKGLSQLLKQLGQRFQLHLLSGDQDKERTQLAKHFSYLHFRQSPEDKLRYIEELDKAGAKVAMLGDGLNDAGALQKADVGISIADEVHQFAPACDAILEACQFSRLEAMFRFARKTRKVVYGALLISLAYNLLGLSFAVLGQLTPLVAAILMPLSSITTVGFITVLVNGMAKQSLPQNR